MRRDFIRDIGGGPIMEFTIVFMLLILLTFGIVDFAFAMWQWNSAEKATQIGARAAVTASPVVQELATWDCNNGSISLGTPCRLGGSSFGSISCTSTSCSGTGSLSGNTYDSGAFNTIVSRMQTVFPRIQPANVIVEYNDLGLCFAGRGSPCPAVTIRLTGMTFNFVTLDWMLGSINMPEFRTTLTGEDLSSAGTI